MGNLSQLILQMSDYEEGCVERVNHFLKVYGFAKTIGMGESLSAAEQEILEAAAITHDIGIKVCYQKYGNCAGPNQEKEGPPIAAEMLPPCGYTPEQTQRVCYLIAHHHTYNQIDGMDYQILVEADFLVNIFEGNTKREGIEHVRDTIFKTKTGLHLLNTLFLRD